MAFLHREARLLRLRPTCHRPMAFLHREARLLRLRPTCHWSMCAMWHARYAARAWCTASRLTFAVSTERRITCWALLTNIREACRAEACLACLACLACRTTERDTQRKEFREGTTKAHVWHVGRKRRRRACSRWRNGSRLLCCCRHAARLLSSQHPFINREAARWHGIGRRRRRRASRWRNAIGRLSVLEFPLGAVIPGGYLLLTVWHWRRRWRRQRRW